MKQPIKTIVLPSTSHRGSGRRCQQGCKQMIQISKAELDDRAFKALQAELEKRQKDSSKIQKVV